MANREELAIIRDARAGHVQAQLALGKVYLAGSASLPRSLATALHWLQRAAQQGSAEAWQLIGSQVPFEVAQARAASVLPWYLRAYDDGVPRAGLVLAQLVLTGGWAADAGLRSKALAALESAARSGLAEAQWLLAQHNRRAAPAGAACAPVASVGAPGKDGAPHAEAGHEWLTRAADGGVAEAQHTLLDRAWRNAERSQFLYRALPLARALLRRYGGQLHQLSHLGQPAPLMPALAPREALLLARCAEALGHGADGDGGRDDRAGPDGLAAADAQEPLRLRELAAHAGERSAQLALGLWLARMDGDGERTRVAGGTVNFKRAIRWLTRAGEQGAADAWFALARIYLRPEFAQRSMTEALDYLQRAAGLGHRAAQFEAGMYAWRSRRDGNQHDVRAAYWLLQAAAQGHEAAEAALRKVAPALAEAGWAGAAAGAGLGGLARRQPLLAARIELARWFGLSRAEALLLDFRTADQGHCLLVDIRACHGRSKRRLVLVRSVEQRQALNRLGRLFDGVDSGPDGPEGNYRQRLYRLKTCWPAPSAAPPGRAGTLAAGLAAGVSAGLAAG